MPTTTIRRHFVTRCPTCDGVVHHNHRCPGARPDPPVPFDRQEFDRIRAAARAEVRAQHAAGEQLVLEVGP